MVKCSEPEIMGVLLVIALLYMLATEVAKKFVAGRWLASDTGSKTIADGRWLIES